MHYLLIAHLKLNFHSIPFLVLSLLLFSLPSQSQTNSDKLDTKFKFEQAMENYISEQINDADRISKALRSNFYENNDPTTEDAQS